MAAGCAFLTGNARVSAGGRPASCRQRRDRCSGRSGDRIGDKSDFGKTPAPGLAARRLAAGQNQTRTRHPSAMSTRTTSGQFGGNPPNGSTESPCRSRRMPATSTNDRFVHYEQAPLVVEVAQRSPAARRAAIRRRPESAAATARTPKFKLGITADLRACGKDIWLCAAITIRSARFTAVGTGRDS